MTDKGLLTDIVGLNSDSNLTLIGEWVITGSSDGHTISILNWKDDPSERHTLIQGHYDRVTALCLYDLRPNPDKASPFTAQKEDLNLFSGGADCLIKRSSLVTGEPLISYEGHQLEISGLVVAHPWLFSTDVGGEIMQWDIPNPKSNPNCR